MMYRQRRPRHGWTLIEAVIAMTLTAILGAILLPALLHGLAGHRNLRTEIDLIESTTRLGMQFRRDVRRAMTATIESIDQTIETTPLSGDPPRARQRLVLGGEGPPIVYQVEGDTITRQTIDSAGQPSREGFRMPAEASHQWQIEPQASTQVSLNLEFPGAHPKSARRKIRMRAITAAGE